jgi:hypothetical protein
MASLTEGFMRYYLREHMGLSDELAAQTAKAHYERIVEPATYEGVAVEFDGQSKISAHKMRSAKS